MGTVSAKSELPDARDFSPRAGAARPRALLGGLAPGRGMLGFLSGGCPPALNAAARCLVLCCMLLSLLVAGAGLARASVACFDDMEDQVTAASESGADHMERADHADDSRDSKHTLARMCCAHGGVSGLSATESVVVVRIARDLVYALRVDPPHVARAPAPELAPPRPASV